MVSQRRIAGHGTLSTPFHELPDGRDHRGRPKVLEKPWKSAPRRWTLGNGEVYEFYCTNNKELEELQKLRELELKQGK